MSKEYERILVAVDGSENSQLALSEAVAIAKRNKAQLFITKIIPNETHLYAPELYIADFSTVERQAVEEEMQRYVNYAIENGQASVVPIIKTSSPKREIAETIPAENKIDLIVIGVTGKGAIERMFIGSVAQYVSAHAVCNVLLIKEPTKKE